MITIQICNDKVKVWGGLRHPRTDDILDAVNRAARELAGTCGGWIVDSNTRRYTYRERIAPHPG